jgi:hypothetical protein
MGGQNWGKLPGDRRPLRVAEVEAAGDGEWAGEDASNAQEEPMNDHPAGRVRRFGPGAVAWPVVAVAVTALCALIYLVVQTDLRIGANDPQIQLAEDAAAALAQGKQPSEVVPTTAVDVASSLAPHVTVFDDKGHPLLSSARLEGSIPTPPPGVFAYVRSHADDRFTWQPRPGVRIAAVLKYHGGPRPGFVLAGRSLREVEKREDQLTSVVALAWVLTLGMTLATALLMGRLLR